LKFRTRAFDKAISRQANRFVKRHPGFQGAARALYFDDTTGRLKPGSDGKGAGCPRRLAKVRWQFDVTWDLFALTSERFVGMLPREFSRFKPRAVAANAGNGVSADATASLGAA